MGMNLNKWSSLGPNPLRHDLAYRDRVVHNVLVRMGEIDGMGKWDGTGDPRFIEYAKKRYGWWGYTKKRCCQWFRGISVWIE